MITKAKEDCTLPLAKAIIFDFIGTLTNVKNYSLENSKTKLYKAIWKQASTLVQKVF